MDGEFGLGFGDPILAVMCVSLVSLNRAAQC